jgi:FkbM family methyltransferase
MFHVNLIRLLINVFDKIEQRKIISFFKKKLNHQLIIFDVGSHHGETIKLFHKNFNIKEIHSFEASTINFNILKKKKMIKHNHIFINNFGLSDSCRDDYINQTIESSSSTICEINKKSNYYKKKIRILGVLNNKNFTKKISIKLRTLDNYIKEKKIKQIDILKIDTEGHEHEVLLGAKKNLNQVKFIYFEHHYDCMIKKKYKFSDINNFLINNNFRQVLKSKMIFRKTFEYVYQNNLQ